MAPLGGGLVGVGVLAAVLVGLLPALWVRPSRVGSSPPGLRWLGGGVGLGLALLGAGVWVGDREAPLGALLAVGGAGLAALWFLGADLLWPGRAVLLRSGLPVGLLGGGVGFWLGGGWAAWVGGVLAGVWAAQLGWLLGHPGARARLGWLGRRTEPWMVFLALAVLVRVPVPIYPQEFPLLALAQMVLLGLSALLWAFGRLGWRALGLAAVAFGLGLGVEFVGSRTGLPFGRYTYEGAPGPHLWGVPLIVPLGWFALVLSAHALARGRVVRVGLMAVAWDLGLEALMTAQGYWTWQDPHPFWYGAPLLNYLAWFAVGCGLSWVYGRLAPSLSAGGFGWAYRLEALFLPTGLALLGFWPAALVCGLAMNLLAWEKERCGEG
ncbi:MAG: carotenoid biosynthesis protein [Meiothermus sp.]|uniref:carotenoid biosynthesis protein n=1 Tax=Meiothermus sp. TaxID=1955249 RepID=UPI0025CEF27E|nr:carotenoid biosynthesis protein [Meiothermus sp.]MCS7193600.1 carotenoid biosynthesis protein [Meiothermus sp.]MDW8090613.1 carotenoid biosynthesis protein [Meiothermus sp.]